MVQPGRRASPAPAWPPLCLEGVPASRELGVQERDARRAVEIASLVARGKADRARPGLRTTRRPCLTSRHVQNAPCFGAGATHEVWGCHSDHAARGDTDFLLLYQRFH